MLNILLKRNIENNYKKIIYKSRVLYIQNVVFTN